MERTIKVNNSSDKELGTCPICGRGYNGGKLDHDRPCSNYQAACKHFDVTPLRLDSLEAIKLRAWCTYSDESLPLDKRSEAVLNTLSTYFYQSLFGSFRSKRKPRYDGHPSAKEYIAELLRQNSMFGRFPKEVVQRLRQQYGIEPNTV